MNVASRAGRPAPAEEITVSVIAMLIEHGADVNAANATGQTPLHLAVGRGDRIVRYLAEHGARLDAKDSSGRTALDLAMGVAGTGGAGGRGGRGGRGGPGGPAASPQVYESTAALLKELSTSQVTGNK
jgi:hypothetical protein